MGQRLLTSNITLIKRPIRLFKASITYLSLCIFILVFRLFDAAINSNFYLNRSFM